ncbi:UNVERIFIED_CONTAM: putative folate-biopterin transporter 6 [Sesamum angustifolium]|uniref:Folate-biopterin transporter 6 n=1 Tax=Sesamum angustifolium TaxID=2727405 RepID=A0AAW2M8U3_9LAMI
MQYLNPMEQDQSQKPLTKTDQEQEEDNYDDGSEKCSRRPGFLSSTILEPFQWLQMLSSRLNPTFVLGVVLVYGLNQGFSWSFFKVVSDYYWKDVQKLQPSAVQLFIGLYYIPWVMKPIWGLLTDVFPVKGYRRRPYFVLAGIIGTVSALSVAAGGQLLVVLALTCLIGVAAGVAIADVTIDACIARNSIEISWCSLGYSTSGFFVHHLGAQIALGILAVPPATLIVLGFVIYELRTTDELHIQKNKSTEKLREAAKGMLRTIQFPQVWKPSLYMYLSLALSISTHEGQFYWYTRSQSRPCILQGICRDDLCNGRNGLDSWSGHLPQNSQELPFQGLALLCTNPVRRVRDARSSVYSAMELSPWSPRLRLCSNGRMRFTDRGQNPVDAYDSLELTTMSLGHRGHVLCTLDVHRQSWFAHLQMGWRSGSSSLERNQDRFQEPVALCVDQKHTQIFDVGSNRHTIILMQTSQHRATRTFMDYESISQAMDGICGLYERKLKELNPAMRNITYDISDLYNFIDGLADMSALVYDHSIQAYLPYDRQWIKQRTLQHLKKLAH